MNIILYLCVHNAARSQMAEAFTNKLGQEKGLEIKAVSAGTIGGDKVNPTVVEAMQEIGISMDGHHPKLLTQEMADQADKIISMGCGVDSDACPARFLLTEDWGLDDPKGQGIESVRAIRDQIKELVENLLKEFSATS
jgi:arsenate reductase